MLGLQAHAIASVFFSQEHKKSSLLFHVLCYGEFPYFVLSIQFIHLLGWKGSIFFLNPFVSFSRCEDVEVFVHTCTALKAVEFFGACLLAFAIASCGLLACTRTNVYLAWKFAPVVLYVQSTKYVFMGSPFECKVVGCFFTQAQPKPAIHRRRIRLSLCSQ